MKNRIEVDEVVLTKWDDSEKPIKGVVCKTYRGHRSRKFLVELSTGEREIVDESQIVG